MVQLQSCRVPSRAWIVLHAGKSGNGGVERSVKMTRKLKTLSYCNENNRLNGCHPQTCQIAFSCWYIIVLRYKFLHWYDYESWYPLGRPIGTTRWPKFIDLNGMDVHELCTNFKHIMINFVASAPPAVPAVKNVVFVVAVVVAVIVVVVVVVVAVGVVVVVVAAVVFAVVVVVVVVVVDDAVAVGWVLCAPKTLEKRKGFRGQKINPKD